MANKISLSLGLRLNQSLLNDKAIFVRQFSIHTSKQQKDNYKLLVIGGGTGGLSASYRFVNTVGANNVAIVDGAEWHCK